MFTDVIALEENTVCADVFPSNSTAFGDHSTCTANSKNIDIQLLGNPSIGLGNLLVNMTKVY